MPRSVESPAVREVAAARAMDDLRFIRTAMEDASGFTSVPGAWLAVVGGVALGTVAYLRFGADAAPGSARWVVAWGIAAGSHRRAPSAPAAATCRCSKLWKGAARRNRRADTSPTLRKTGRASSK